MTDGALDFLSMVLVLAIVIVVGFSLIIPLVDTELMQYNETIKDKAMVNTVKDYSDLAENNLVPTQPLMSAREVVLMSQIQDVTMPLPRKFRVVNPALSTTIDVTSTYALTVRSVGMAIWTRLPNQDLSSKYSVDYGFGDGAIVGDEAFDIRIQ